MGKNTEISWTTHTYNPWWGCVKVSPGCAHCYAETFSKRTGNKVWGVDAPRRFFGDKHWNEPVKWNACAEKIGIRDRVFCGSMCDVCEDRRDLDEHRKRLRELIASTPMLDWQLLTKRPENFLTLFPWGDKWPENVWAGCTVENQEQLAKRLKHLVKVPSRVRFLSCEPLLDQIDISVWLSDIHWVIVGGESGHGARPFDIYWARSIVSQCKAAGVACFVKQLGSNPSASLKELGLDESDEDNVDRLELEDSKGGDINEFPGDLRVREMPL